MIAFMNGFGTYSPVWLHDHRGCGDFIHKSPSGKAIHNLAFETHAALS